MGRLNDTAGSSFVEYCALVVVVALAGMAGWRLYGRALDQRVRLVSAEVTQLAAGRRGDNGNRRVVFGRTFQDGTAEPRTRTANPLDVRFNNEEGERVFYRAYSGRTDGLPRTQAQASALAAELGSVIEANNGRPLSDAERAILLGQARSMGSAMLAAEAYATEQGADDDDPGLMLRFVHDARYSTNPPPGWTDVDLHGSPTLVVEGGEHQRPLTIPELADRMRAAGYDGGPVRLVSCSTGGIPTTGGVSVAQRLADELGAPVVAPTRTLLIASNGATASLPLVNEEALRHGDYDPEGGWRVFYPR